MDRLDYVSMMCNEHAYCLAVERLLGIEVPIRAQYIRVMFAEITRILNHLCGSVRTATIAAVPRSRSTPSVNGKTCSTCMGLPAGACMHAAYFRPGGVYRDLPDTMPQYKASKGTQCQRCG